MAERKIIALFIGIAVLNFLVSIGYASMSSLPGGEISLAPFVIPILSLFAVVISTTIFWITKIWTDSVTPVKSVFLYQAVYLLILCLSANIEGDDSLTEFLLWSYLLSFLVVVVLIAVLWKRHKDA
jgi:hypothetical protein